MIAHPFSQLFFSPFQESKNSEEKSSLPKRKWMIYLSRQDERVIEVEATSISQACHKALAQAKRESAKEDWQVDHSTPNLEYVPRFRR